MSDWSKNVVAYRWPVLFCAAIVTVVFAYAASGLTTDNSLQLWLSPGDKRLEQYDRFQEAFGSDEYLFVALEGSDWTTPEGIEQTRRLSELLRVQVPEAITVESLSDVYDALSASPNGISDFNHYLSINKNLYRSLISEDRLVTAIRIAPAGFARPKDRIRFVSRVRDIVDAQEGLSCRMGGPPLINYELNELSSKEPARYYPFVILMIVAMLALLLRSLSLGLCCLAAPALATVWTLGVLRLTGGSFNMVLVALPPLLLLLGVSYSVHLTTRFLSGSAETPQQRAEDAICVTFPACFLAAVTTAAGFLSLTVSPVRPIRSLGVFCAIGILFSFLASVTVLPALLSFRRRRSADASLGRGETLQRLGGAALIWRKPILIVGTVLICVAVLGIMQIDAESHILRFFRPEHPLIKDYEFMENHLTGLTPLDVVISGPHSVIESADVTNRVQALQAYLVKEYPTVKGSVSSIDLTRAAQSAGISDIGLLPKSVTRPFVHHAGDQTALHVMASLHTTGSATYTRVKTGTEAYLAEHFSDLSGVQARVDGIVPLLSEMQEVIIASQVRSLGVALVVISILMIAVLRSLRLAIIALVPNLFPVALILGVMGWCGIRLDTATLTIASVAMGVAVDDTIHFLVHYQAARRRYNTLECAVAVVMRTVGRSIVITSLVAVCGFVLLGLSQFPPLAYFGLLLALTLAVAVAADFTLLPSLLAVADHRGPKGESHAC